MLSVLHLQVPRNPILALAFFAMPFFSTHAFSEAIPSGCYRVRHAGIAGLFQPSALVTIQATGKDSYILRDAKGRLFTQTESLSFSTLAGPKTEFQNKGRGYPRFEMKSSDGRWLNLDSGRWSLTKVDPFPTEYQLKPDVGCTEAEVDIAVKAGPSIGMRGIADLHAHPFANEGFGGALFQGKSFDPYGITQALKSCEAVHGIGGIKDLAGNGIDGGLTHNTSGFPTFKGWPAWNDSNHQQTYYRWMERAWRGGLRLIVAHAVNSEALCRLVQKIDDRSCDDMQAVDRQLDAALEMEAYVDAQFGGPGKGWLRIVRTPSEARKVITDGKLAMVLGIEVDSLFGCRVGSCSEADVLAALTKYEAKGVRHIFPIHVTDNAFGGSALYTPAAFNVANKMQNGDFFGVEDCSAKGITYQETSFGDSEWAQAVLKPTNLLPTYPAAGGHCNARGLTDLGQFTIKAMMKRRILIDIDHMSLKTSEAVLTIAENYHYPLISGHTGFVVTSTPGQKRSEGQKTDDQLRRVIQLGGMVGAILHQGKAHDEILDFGTIKNDCDDSSKSWVQAYTYALSAFREEGVTPKVSYGSDFNGFVHMPAPRFGPLACAENPDQAVQQQKAVAYPFVSPWTKATFGRMRSGSKIYDINVDGFANIGLLPDYIAELSQVGVADEDIDPLFQSAEAYVKLWEQAEAAGSAVNSP